MQLHRWFMLIEVIDKFLAEVKDKYKDKYDPQTCKQLLPYTNGFVVKDFNALQNDTKWKIT